MALGARGGQGITPEVLDVLNVFLVLLESLDDLVVIAVGLRPQRFVALQQDHRRAVRTELFERRPDAHHRLERHRVLGTLRHRVVLGDDLQLRATMVLVTKTMPSQIRTIGSASRWIIRGRNGGISG